MWVQAKFTTLKAHSCRPFNMRILKSDLRIPANRKLSYMKLQAVGNHMGGQSSKVQNLIVAARMIAKFQNMTCKYFQLQ